MKNGLTNYAPMHEISKQEGRIGAGNWDAFPKEMIPEVIEVAKDWKEAFSGIEKPWLCWGVEDEICKIQQRLVKSVGWTPIVGHDTNLKPTVLEGSLYVDFNKRLQLKHMRMFFPMEWMHLFCDKLAFWHSDILLSMKDMQQCATVFDQLTDGEMSAVWNQGRWFGLRDRHANKWYAVVGCSTAKASREQYELGCGWWRHIDKHPNYREEDYTKTPHYDHEIGVTMWQKKYGGKVVRLKPDLRGHMTSTQCKHTVSKEEDLASSYNVARIADLLGIEEFLS